MGEVEEIAANTRHEGDDGAKGFNHDETGYGLDGDWAWRHYDDDTYFFLASVLAFWSFSAFPALGVWTCPRDDSEDLIE